MEYRTKMSLHVSDIERNCLLKYNNYFQPKTLRQYTVFAALYFIKPKSVTVYFGNRHYRFKGDIETIA